jgi:dTDP-4-amino-4,6-dideoxygalactose transaminase
MVRINAIAKPRGLFVVEDCALAVGSSFDGVACGLLGDVGAFSFYPVKHMTTGEGGMVVSRHADVVASIENLKAFGYDRSPGERKVPGVYDIARLGLNYRMNEMAAAIGLEQIRKVPAFDRARRRNAAALRAALADVAAVRLLADGDTRYVHANYCLVAVLEPSLAPRRAGIIDSMKRRAVGTSVYYPVPVPLSSYYRSRYSPRPDEFPNATRISNDSIALPVGPHLTEPEMNTVAEALRAAILENNV